MQFSSPNKPGINYHPVNPLIGGYPDSDKCKNKPAINYHPINLASRYGGDESNYIIALC